LTVAAVEAVEVGFAEAAAVVVAAPAVVDAVVAVIAAAVNEVVAMHFDSYLCLGNSAVVKLAAVAFAAVVALQAVAVVVAAAAAVVVVPAVAADLARKAVGTLRKTQEEHCDGAAVVAAVAAAVVAVSEDMVEAVVAAVVVENATSWAWAFLNQAVGLGLPGNYCFGYYSSCGAACGTRPSFFGAADLRARPFRVGLRACLPDAGASY
jgi:hypothetical protein